MITTTGLRMIQELITSGDHAHITHLAPGSGTTAPLISDSGLEYEIGTRKSVSYSAIGSPDVGDTYSVIWNSVEANNIGSISECGLFSALTTGSMFSRATFTAINLTEGSDYKMEWNVQIV